MRSAVFMHFSTFSSTGTLDLGKIKSPTMVGVRAHGWVEARCISLDTRRADDEKRALNESTMMRIKDICFGKKALSLFRNVRLICIWIPSIFNRLRGDTLELARKISDQVPQDAFWILPWKRPKGLSILAKPKAIVISLMSAPFLISHVCLSICVFRAITMHIWCACCVIVCQVWVLFVSIIPSRYGECLWNDTRQTPPPHCRGCCPIPSGQHVLLNMHSACPIIWLAGKCERD